ncbi:kinase [Candidatus Neptunochlamydia vexilliferae]|uniref:GHMP family kinase ATP-binding protein n=1 Tax=Candidatus Neptunichlamydia vexilliferae TaxID=1651774 RepID=UPI001890DACF|nr:kinase [Candidatus Neptunochlamydia vexilliferae]
MLIQSLKTHYQQGRGSSHGTFGELLQGILPNGRNFMVTLPISLYSRAHFEPRLEMSHVTVSPKEKKKSAVMAEKILERFEISIGGVLTIDSDIPEGKGLASSSADLVATAYALKETFFIEALDSDLIASLIKEIEPTDGIMYPGSSTFYYKEVELKESLAHLPRFVIVGIDEGHTVDTLTYNKKEKCYTPECSFKYAKLLEKVTSAVKEGDLKTIGAIATESARMNQRHHDKPSLEAVISFCEEVKGLGVAIAHSGTFIGVLLDPSLPSFDLQLKRLTLNLKEMGKTAHLFHSLTEED